MVGILQSHCKPKGQQADMRQPTSTFESDNQASTAEISVPEGKVIEVKWLLAMTANFSDEELLWLSTLDERSLTANKTANQSSLTLTNTRNQGRRVSLKSAKAANDTNQLQRQRLDNAIQADNTEKRNLEQNKENLARLITTKIKQIAELEASSGIFKNFRLSSAKRKLAKMQKLERQSDDYLERLKTRIEARRTSLNKKNKHDSQTISAWQEYTNADLESIPVPVTIRQFTDPEFGMLNVMTYDDKNSNNEPTRKYYLASQISSTNTVHRKEYDQPLNHADFEQGTPELAENEPLFIPRHAKIEKTAEGYHSVKFHKDKPPLLVKILGRDTQGAGLTKKTVGYFAININSTIPESRSSAANYGTISDNSADSREVPMDIDETHSQQTEYGAMPSDVDQGDSSEYDSIIIED